MKKKLNAILAFTLVVNCITAQTLNEIMPDPSGADGGATPGEWIELFGIAGTDIGCYVVTDGDWAITIPTGTTIPASGYYVIGRTAAASPSTANSANSGNPAVLVTVDLNLVSCACTQNINGSTEVAPGLTNGGEYVGLFDATGSFVEGTIYNTPSAGNQPTGAGAAESLSASGGCTAKTVDIASNSASFVAATGGISFFARTPNGTGAFSGSSNNNLATPGAINPVALPIVLQKFDVTTQGQSALLSFTTATEINNSHFDIERSADGRNFQKIGEVAGAGNSLVERRYAFTDAQPLKGTNYYRLRQVDFDGQSSYSPVRTATFGKGNIVVVAPSPATDRVTVTLESSVQDETTWQVFDATGRLVLTGVWPAEATALDMEVHTLPEGAYTFRLANGQDVTVKQFRKL
jgi:Secretion system C-terminal sorting domain